MAKIIKMKKKVELTEEQKLERKAKVKKILINAAETIACAAAGALLVIGSLAVIGSKDETKPETVDAEFTDLDETSTEDSSEEPTEN
jgi:hypothetical protein